MDDRFVPESDFWAYDYLKLPDCGEGHYSLTDAALLVAIDQWREGNVPGVGLDEEADAWEDDDHRIRTALAPFATEVAQMLAKSVADRELEAIVCARSWPDSFPDRDRTYVDVQDLVDWLEVHGRQRGDMLAKLQMEDLGDSALWRAQEVARDRAAFRHGNLAPIGSSPISSAGGAELLQAQLKEARLQLAHLHAELRKAPSAAARKESPRRERTLLKVIAALAQKCGIDPQARAAAPDIKRATEDLGAPVDDETIRRILRSIPEALDKT